MSMPSSCMTAAAVGLTREAGSVPADSAARPSRRAKASAICERHELPTQTKSTLRRGAPDARWAPAACRAAPVGGAPARSPGAGTPDCRTRSVGGAAMGPFTGGREKTLPYRGNARAPRTWPATRAPKPGLRARQEFRQGRIEGRRLLQVAQVASAAHDHEARARDALGQFEGQVRRGHLVLGTDHDEGRAA